MKTSRKPIKFLIPDANIAKKAPFIYFIFAQVIDNQGNVVKALYIGQTLSSLGPMGRLNQHLSDLNFNTFKQRLNTALNYQPNSLKKVHFAAFCLTSRAEFTSNARDYREAIEYLVQQKIINFITSNSIGIVVVSIVRSNNFISQPFVSHEGNEIFTGIIRWINSFS